jgi:hypothetical protein
MNQFESRMTIDLTHYGAAGSALIGDVDFPGLR